MAATGRLRFPIYTRVDDNEVEIGYVDVDYSVRMATDPITRQPVALLSVDKVAKD